MQKGETNYCFQAQEGEHKKFAAAQQVVSSVVYLDPYFDFKQNTFPVDKNICQTDLSTQIQVKFIILSSKTSFIKSSPSGGN